MVDKTMTIPNLKHRFNEDVVPQVREQFSLKNTNQLPQLSKVVLNLWCWSLP